MPRKPKLNTEPKSVKDELQRMKGKVSHASKPTRASGRRAERIAAKQAGISELVPREASNTKKKVSRNAKGRAA